jgi:DNA-binding CsgD family transcriptional regulator
MSEMLMDSGQFGARGQGAHVFNPEEWLELGQALHLSGRELQIVQRIFDDEKEARIARALTMSPHTVHTHFGRLYRKLRTNSRCGVMLRVFATHLDLQGDAQGNAEVDVSPEQLTVS